MNPSEMMSPVRRKVPRADVGGTPSTVRMERSLHHPSPNRTEAAAAMMHLFSSSTTSGADSASSKTASGALARPAILSKTGKVKRRYVRKAPKKINTSVKRDIKSAWTGPTPSPKSESAQTSQANDETMEGIEKAEEGQSDSKTKATEGDDSRFFPFREYNRKEKSLGLLCEKFLKLYRGDHISEVCLDKAASELGVERRRIYDIVNILESIFLVSRKSKNLYNWHGLDSLPKSVSAMKKRYDEAYKASPNVSGGSDYAFKADRRRGKSLSKLSQLFVQLFLVEEHCIIPLDQAAKQLIQMEENENEEDRQLKTKIRRLYDVANVLVSVGLIEKLQLSNCRKPVFRWKSRVDTDDQCSSDTVMENVELKTEFAHHSVNQLQFPAVKSEFARHRNGEMEDADALKTSQSCDSDMSDDGSDSQSDASNCGTKRKQNELDGRDSGSSEDEAVLKRAKADRKYRSTASLSAVGSSVLRLDGNSLPVHPQVVLQEKEAEMKAFMEQYIKEYVDYLMTNQHASPRLGAAQLFTPQSKREATSAAMEAIKRDMHGTPVSMPSLASSIQELLLSESPQSVDLLSPLMRAEKKTIPGLGTSPVGASIEPQADLSPKTLTHKSIERPPSAASDRAPTPDDEEAYLASRNLIRSLQPPTMQM